MNKTLLCLLVAAATALPFSTGHATPYASSITNSGTAISFRLNEAADSVRIISNGGATTNELGARPAGLTITNLAITGTFYIEVNKNGTIGYLYGVTNTISADTNRLLRFNAPRGIAVNRNPASPFFGRVYVSNADTGSVATAGSFPSRNLVQGDGIFLLNADFSDAVGQGDVARTGGIDWRTNLNDTANKPFRLEVGEDNNLYISDYTSPTNTLPGNLWVTDGNVSPTSGTNVFTFDSSVSGRFPSSVIARGSLAAGNLTLYGICPDIPYFFFLDQTFTLSYSVLQKWSVGSGPLPSSNIPEQLTDLPVLIADVPSVLSDFDLAPDGKYFMTQYRNNGTNAESGLFVLDPTRDANNNGFADIIWQSKPLSSELGFTTDLLIQSRAVKVSPSGRVVAVMRDDNSVMIIPLTNGVPDIAGRRILNTGSTTTLGRDLTFDAADNLLIASSGQGAVKAFAPGFGSRAVTGSDGTFTFTNFVPSTTLSLSLVDTNASEPGADTAEFTISRDGDLSQPVSFRIAYTGTATFGVDYTAPTNITLGAGVASTNISVTVLDDSLGEAIETIIASIPPGTNYFTSGNSSGTLFVADDGDLPLITVSTIDTNIYERMSNDTARIAVVRAGDLSAPLTVNITVGGTAVAGTDYTALPTSITINAGQSRATNVITGIDNALQDGNRTVVIGIAPGAGYVVSSSNNTATALIRDDETATLPVLFSDDFDTDHSADYTVRFGADNGVDDKIVDFNFDYGAISIPSAPHSTGGTTRGLKITVNKNDATGSTAGANVYLNNYSFSNEYALRFDMFLSVSNIAASTEHAIFGLNHSGNRTNRAVSAGALVGGDGVWAAVEADGSASSSGRSYALFASTNPAVAAPFNSVSARAFDTFFTAPPFTFGGAPGSQWADVELSQTNLNGSYVWTLKINNVVILSRTNNGAATFGTIMLGHMDSFASVGSVGTFTLIDNVRVVNLTQTALTVRSVRRVGANVEIDFTAEASAEASAFVLESSTALPGGFTADAGSSVVSLGGGNFRAISPNSGDANRFYRIRK